MTKAKMTVHQALCELKIIDKRIAESVDKEVICANRYNNPKINGMSVDDVKISLRANYDKTKSLIDRKNAMKAALVQSNATTFIYVGGVQMSVAQAIYENGDGIDIKTSVLNEYKRQYSVAVNKVSAENGDKLDTKVENYLINTFGNCEKGNKTDDMVKAEEIFRKNNQYDLIDPNGLKAEIDRLQDKIDTFKAEVDSALQISNATTTIEFEY